MKGIKMSTDPIKVFVTDGSRKVLICEKYLDDQDNQIVKFHVSLGELLKYIEKVCEVSSYTKHFHVGMKLQKLLRHWFSDKENKVKHHFVW